MPNPTAVRTPVEMVATEVLSLLHSLSLVTFWLEPSDLRSVAVSWLVLPIATMLRLPLMVRPGGLGAFGRRSSPPRARPL